MNDGTSAVAVVGVGSGARLEAVSRLLGEAGWVVEPYVASASLRSEAEFVSEIAAAHNRIDLLVAGPTIVGYGAIDAMDPDEWWSIVDGGLGHAFRLARACAPWLAARRGSIVLLSAQAGIRGTSMGTAISASAGGLVGLTRALAQELAPVRVNAVAAGPAGDDDDLAAFARATSLTPDQARSSAAQMTLLGRLASHEEVAQSVVFLASDQATYYTGEVLSPSGGRTQQ